MKELLRGIAWVVGILFTLYVIGFAAMVISYDGVVRALNTVGVSGDFLNFLYDWILFDPNAAGN